MLHKRYFWVKHILENYIWMYVSYKFCIVTLLFMIIYESAYSYSYGELHDLLAWKRLAS